ncbi:tetratricopeptide repeat-containing sensor histidine kinase [Chryseobacterium rhizosphaerae]|uniref:tetratricopeptide repeat-containing sensor histidine kinase n=1 Tax=Chryseobacterium rhizosphaerae TaxID=395937 RepID=UPI003D12D935
MRTSLCIIVLLMLLFSCKKENKIKHNPNNTYYQKAKICRNSKIADSAFHYFNLAKEEYLTRNDSLGAGKSLVNMAIIQSEKGDFYGSIETSLEANNFLKKKKNDTIRTTLASSYNNMAISSSQLNNLDQAIIFFLNAVKYTNNNEDRYIYYNNIGDILIIQKKFKQAQQYLEKAILVKNSSDYARALNNLTIAKYRGNKNFDPLPDFYQALDIREKRNDKWGENSSFATLSDYFLEKDNNKSLFFAKEMLETATSIKSPNDQLQALMRIIYLEPKNYLINFKKFNTLNDSLQTARSKAKNQFAVIRYDVEKNKAENRKLKVQKAEKEVQLLYRNIGIGALSLSLIGGLFWYRRRKKRLQQEKELEVKNTQLKMSKKVHDVVANGIYQVMTKIENQEDFDRDKALDELEFVYEKSRDISYDKIGEEKEFSKVISELIASFNNEMVKTFTAGNSSAIWEPISAPVKEEIYQIIRELMVNMKKHSQATHVAVRFEKINNLVEIQYKDNGIGISGDFVHKNGLRNAASRIESINGTITFDTKIEKGLKVNLSFPVS